MKWKYADVQTQLNGPFDRGEFLNEECDFCALENVWICAKRVSISSCNSLSQGRRKEGRKVGISARKKEGRKEGRKERRSARREGGRKEEERRTRRTEGRKKC